MTRESVRRLRDDLPAEEPKKGFRLHLFFDIHCMITYSHFRQASRNAQSLKAPEEESTKRISPGVFVMLPEKAKPIVRWGRKAIRVSLCWETAELPGGKLERSQFPSILDNAEVGTYAKVTDFRGKDMAVRAREGSGLFGSKDLIGQSSGFVAEMSKIPKVACCSSGVLILGETGTGKEVCARKIHTLSPRADKPFVPVNCGAIPVELAENELFGHRRGAFTGAATSKPGLIEEAEGGTLFLDEVDSLPLLAQVKLLRFLQERTYRPLGSTRELASDVRVIAAMNSNPEDSVREGRLRQDLYYRLNIVTINIPPLRDRREDIPLLARHFLEKYSFQIPGGVERFSESAIQKLQFYDWPGNVRELEHVIERTLVLCDEKVIRAADISLPEVHCVVPCEEPFNEAKRKFVDQFERSYLEKLLISHQGNITRAAHAAQKHRRALFELIRKHGIEVDQFRSSSPVSH
jgi:transcriptional regulator with PAS, ATPase and Fis domain